MGGSVGGTWVTWGDLGDRRVGLSWVCAVASGRKGPSRLKGQQEGNAWPSLESSRACPPPPCAA